MENGQPRDEKLRQLITELASYVDRKLQGEHRFVLLLVNRQNEVAFASSFNSEGTRILLRKFLESDS